MSPDEKENFEHFEKRTYREVTVWDWLGRVLPMTVLALISICYFFEWHTWLDILLEVTVGVFFIVCFIWWYWAIYKIATMVKYLRQSQKNFQSLLEDFKNLRASIKNRNNPKNR
jgi:hypothetical protein